MKQYLEGSADAIAHVQEGIVVDANKAWLELFGYSGEDALTGTPLMDLFEQETHPALKGALIACLQGKWTDHALKVRASLSDSSTLPLEITLTKTDYEGESAVRVCVPSRQKENRDLEGELADAVKNDPSTGFLQQRHLISAVQERCALPMKGGVRQFALIKPDRFADIQSAIGVLRSEDFLVQLAELVRPQLTPNDICGRFGGNGLLVLLERGTARDMEAWAEAVIARIGQHTFGIADKTLSATATIGLGLVAATNPDVGAAVNDAVTANRRGRELGGNQMYAIDKADTDTRVQAYDRIWVKHIKSALMENRFRLVQQPIASLLGEDKGMFDVLVRMLDEQGNEVLPSEFIAAAERNDLMKNIDRWVIGASLAFAAKRHPDLLFVRLSKDSVTDAALLPWLATQLKATGTDPQRLCLQVTEEVAVQYPAQVRQLAAALRELRLRFAVEHFGTGNDPMSLIESLPLDFVKIDGSLMQGLAGNADLQQRVRTIAETAARRSILTVAERIEDANTMAVVWQLGVQYIQGYLVHAPEEVVLTG